MNIERLLTKDFVERNTLPSNIVYGTAIYNRNAIQIIELTPLRIEAWVGGLEGKMTEGGGSKRRVEFTVSGAELMWRCTGNPKDHQIFCKHCVALTLALLNPSSLTKN